MCTGDCNQGRACTCARPGVTIKPLTFWLAFVASCAIWAVFVLCIASLVAGSR